MDDLTLAKKFLSKAQSCKSRQIEFKLNFTSYKNLMRAKKCHYTGLPLTNNTRTIDRVDSNRPYEKGNVVACHLKINEMKAILEYPSKLGVTEDQLFKLMNRWKDAHYRGETK